MDVPQLSGALEGLRLLEASDFPRYSRAVTEGQQIGWGYYFPYLLSRRRPGRTAVLVGEEGSSICLFLWRRRETKQSLELVVAPTPLTPAALARSLERANDFNGDVSARVLRVDANDRALVASLPALRLEERKAQYIYSPKDFGDIAGRRYRTLRRNVSLVERMAGVEVLPYSASHEAACLELLGRWGSVHRDEHGTAGGLGSTRRALGVAGVPANHVRGEVVFVKGQLSAFALGGEIRPGVGCFFDAKSDPEIPGLSYFQRRSFLSKLEDFELVNDGSDVGRAGLRQLKTSLRPVSMHMEYRGIQQRGQITSGSRIEEILEK